VTDLSDLTPTGRTNAEERTSAGSSSSIDLADIYRTHAADVSRWARRLLGPGGDVEDVLHDVFLVAQRRLGEWRGEAKLGTWLYAITINVVQEHRRKEKWRRWLRVERILPLGRKAPATPLETLESRRAADLTYRLLDGLPEAERTALILFEMEGLSGDEIASFVGEAVGTIWVRLHRARARFRERYDAWARRDGET
jgi:RNA polymerase sigma-70 factor (ECF subfamily)